MFKDLIKNNESQSILKFSEIEKYIYIYIYICSYIFRYSYEAPILARLWLVKAMRGPTAYLIEGAGVAFSFRVACLTNNESKSNTCNCVCTCILRYSYIHLLETLRETAASYDS